MASWAADDRYTALVREHGGALLRLATLLTGNVHDGEDAMQDALIQVAQAGTQPRDELAYLKRAVANRAVDLLRRRRDILTDTPPERTSLDAEFLRLEEDREFFRMLERLPPRQRQTLILRYYADLDDRAIARALGVSAVTVRTQARHALTKLRADEALLERRV
jgi:RNA polymerase sigma factor (sigma-70 family)